MVKLRNTRQTLKGEPDQSTEKDPHNILKGKRTSRGIISIVRYNLGF